MTANHYEAIVLGCGGVGAAALWHLARRGVRVLGLDRFEPPHDHGSSHGQTRIIRQAYFEHPDYVPLLLRAYQLWHELEAAAGQSLFFRTGLLQVGSPQGHVVAGVRRAAALHNLRVDHLDSHQANSRFPAFSIPAGLEAVYEHQAGYLLVEECVRAHLQQARACGATLCFGETIRSWQANSGEVVVHTDRHAYRGERLVVAAGPWAGSLMADLGLRLKVLRKHIYWLEAPARHFLAAEGCPAYLFELPAGVFYGFPVMNERGLKLGEHTGGVEVADPLTDDRSPDEADWDRTRAFVQAHLPGAGLVPQHRSVCYYTMTADENFAVDVHARQANVCFAAGLSGHGFKFTSVLGEVLADLAQQGSTALPIGFLRLRNAVTA